MHGFYKWNEVGVRSSIVLATILAVMYTFIFVDLAISKTKYVKMLRSWLYDCPLPCNDGNQTCEQVNSLRGNNYGFDPNIDGGSYREYKDCLFTGWEASHFMFHVFLGYFYNIYISQTLSFTFEIYEHLAADCGSFNDLSINFAGYCVGYGLRHLTTNPLP